MIGEKRFGILFRAKDFFGGAGQAGHIAQASQLFLRFPIRIFLSLKAGRRALPLDEPFQFLPEGGHASRRRLVVFFIEIGFEVIDFRNGRTDEFLLFVDETPDGCPVHVVEGRKGFKVDGLIGALFPARELNEGVTLKEMGLWDAEQLTNGGEYIDMGCARADNPVLEPGSENHERDPESRVVSQVAVRLFAMLAEQFAVVARKNDDRVGQAALGLELVEKNSNGSINGSHFTVIRVGSELRSIGLGRSVGIVRVEGVNPKQPGRRLSRHPS